MGFGLACAGIVPEPVEPPPPEEPKPLPSPQAPPPKETALPPPSKTQIIAGRAGPDAIGGMDRHEFVLDTAPGECVQRDFLEGETREFIGNCSLTVIGESWLTIKMEGQRTTQRDGQPAEEMPVNESILIAWFRDLPPSDQRHWTNTKSRDGDADKALAEWKDCLMVKDHRLYCDPRNP